jgi:hypothetical protein
VILKNCGPCLPVPAISKVEKFTDFGIFHLIQFPADLPIHNTNWIIFHITKIMRIFSRIYVFFGFTGRKFSPRAAAARKAFVGLD